mgnify:CR=1 FL=1
MKGSESQSQPQSNSLSLSLSPSLSLLLYALLAVVVTQPLWLHLADAVPSDIGDPLLNTWILAWDSHALLTDPLHLFDANIFYPLPKTLAYSEHLFSTAILALPLIAFTGEPVLAYNLSLLLSFPLAGLGMYLLVLRWTQRRGAAFLAGLVFAFAPYRLAAIAHLQLLTVQWLPFSLLALDRVLNSQFANRSSKILNRWLLLFVVFTTLQILAGWYLAVFTVLRLGLYTLGWLVAHWRLVARGRVLGTGSWRLILAALVVIGLALVFALPYLAVLPQLQVARPASLAASFAAQPTDFLAAAPYLRIAGPLSQALAERPGFTEENTLFLGVVGPLLALAGLILLVSRPPRGTLNWRTVVLLVILVFSLTLTFAGPYLILIRILPVLTVVRVPPRWIIPGTFALAGLVGLGVARLQEAGQRGHGATETRGRDATDSPIGVTGVVLFLVVSVLLVAEAFAAPLPLAPVGAVSELPPVYYMLREEALREPSEWAVIELPMYVAPAPEFPETKRLYASTLGWWGLVNGYSGFTPARQMDLDRGALAGFPAEGALEALRALGAAGVRYLVVHPGEAPLDRTAWEASGRWQVERQTSLLPVGRFGPDDLDLINPYGDNLITDPTVTSDAYWSANAPTTVDARFRVPNSDLEVELLAYHMSDDEARLTLYWQAAATLDSDYTVFVHSLDDQGALRPG